MVQKHERLRLKNRMRVVGASFAFFANDWFDICNAAAVAYGSSLVSGLAGKSAQEELLCQIGRRSLAGAEQEIFEDEPNSAIRRRIVGVRDRSRCQVASDGRIVRLPAPVISLADEWAPECVQNARPRRARALVEVARILVEKRRQDGATDHNVSKTVRIGSSVALRETLPTLGIVQAVTGLFGGGIYTYPDESYGVEHDLGGELEL